MKVFIIRALVLSLFSTALLVAVKDKVIFNLEEVRVKVDIPEKDRLAWLQVTQQIERTLSIYRGTPIWKISLPDIKQKLAEFPLVKNLQIQKTWPHTLEVNYSLPPLRLIHQTHEGQFKILVGDGQWLGPVKWSRLPELPWARGDWIIKTPVLKATMLNLFQQLPATGALALDQISEVQFSEMDGFLLTLLKSGQQIRFGYDNFEIKSLRVSQVLDYIQTRGLESRVIDANFSKKVLVRLRNHP